MNGSPKVAPKMNTRRGRFCFKFSDEDQREKLLSISDVKVRDEKGLVLALEKARGANASVSRPSNFETQCKTIGLCSWSLPLGDQEMNALWVMGNCINMNGLTFPYPNTPLDEQPNLFFEFLNIYNRAKSDYSSAGFEKSSGVLPSG